MRDLVIAILDRARHRVGTQLGIGVVVGFFVPTVLLVMATSVWPGVTGIALYLISVAYLTTCALMLVEANLAFRRNLRSEPAASSDGWIPDVTVVVVAYLPNEAALVVDTLRHLIEDVDFPGESPQVILAYNTPTPMELEDELQEMASRIPMLDVIRIEDSTSKAENVMGVLAYVRNPVVAILDTDHQLHPDAAQRAVRWFDAGYDVVQGRCVVRNARHNVLTRMVAFEFETIYGIAHAGRSLLVDTGIFGGANGWWRTSVLREVGLDHRMLTEDIDSSLRALMARHRIVHDRSVISTELAPVTFPAWWRQRTRWAQGWFQVTLRHGRDMRHTSALPLPTRIYWGLMLTWRELFPFVSLQVASVVVADLVLGRGLQLRTDPFLIFTTAVTVLSGALVGAAAWHVATRETRAQLSLGWAIAACFLILPYTLVRNAVAIAAIVRELVGDRRWLVTRRSLPTGVSVPLAPSETP